MVTPSDPLDFAGDRLIELTAGKALVFVSDINNNLRVDVEDIVGVSVSRGVQLTSFVNIHGDIVANLGKKGELLGDGGDGSALDPKGNISSIHVLASTLASGTLTHGIVEGQILAGGNINDILVEGGVGAIAAGTAAGGRSIFADVDAFVNGVQIGPVTLDAVVPKKGGASITNVDISVGDTGFNEPGLLSLIQAGDAGPKKGSGGSVLNVTLANLTQPYSIVAGDGATAAKGGAGGIIDNVVQTETSIAGTVNYQGGSGGNGLTKDGGSGGKITNLDLEGSGNYNILAGSGGDGGVKGNGGDGGQIDTVRLEGGDGYNIIAGDGGDGGLNGGRGGYISNLTNSSTVALPAAPSFVLAGNFNNDFYLTDPTKPILDVLTVNSADNSISVLLNDGFGNFSLAGTFAVGMDPRRAAVADLDGDGNLDVVVSNFGSDDVAVLMGNGDGTFDPATFIAVGDGPIGIALAQINARTDNIVDLVVLNSLDNNLLIFQGTGGGQFNTSAVSPIELTGTPTAITTGDLDLASDTDLAITMASTDSVNVLSGNGIFFGGDGTFSGPSQFAVGDNPIDITNANLDLNAFPDLVTVNEGSNNVSFLSGNGGFPNISYDPAVQLAVGNSPTAVTVVNLNGDARSDLVVTNSTDNTVSVLLATDASGFLPATTFAVGADPLSLTSGEFNGDNFQDVIVANRGSANLSLLFGNGDGTFEIAGQDTSGVVIRAGDGGNGGSGKGGNGGFIGLDPSKPQPDIVISNISMAALGGSGIIDMQSGSGGNGGSRGGSGGLINSVELTASVSASVTSGSGGDSTADKGGSGGNIGQGAPDFDVVVNVSGMDNVSELTTGRGGHGATGGGDAGKVSNTQFTSEGELKIVTGNGGNATTTGSGGAGGDVTDSEFAALPFLNVTTGSGGNSIGSTGAKGGSVQSTQFQVTASAVLDPVIPDPGNIVVILGDGGDGTTGGLGGRLTNSNFELIFTEVAVGGGFVDANELVLRVLTGSGGNGTIDGGVGGNLEGVQVQFTQSLLDPTFFVSPGDVFVDLGAGGAGATGTGGAGGSVKNLTLFGVTGDVEINNIDPLDGGRQGRGGDGASGGAGGSVAEVAHLPALGLTGGTLTVRSGDGGDASSGPGGAAGTITKITGEFAGQALHEDGTLTMGLRLLGGRGGDSTTGAGGAGGRIENSNLHSAGASISYTAGDGGTGSTAGGNGGDIFNSTANSADELSFVAGHGGIATGLGGVGGNGGNVFDIFQAANPGEVIRQVVGGNGGDSFFGTGGIGGSITGVHTLGQIGDFESAFGLNQMGGLIAGKGGSGNVDGVNGSVHNVTAFRIAAIFAGGASGPVPVDFVNDVTVNALGANIDGDTDPGEFVLPAFDFVDANSNGQYDLGADPNQDPAEMPIDGLILANTIGVINLPPNVVALYSVEAGPPRTDVGLLDPQP